MAKGVLVDTCIFIDFFRSSGSSNEVFKSLVSEDRVIVSSFVKLELLKGVRVDMLKRLHSLLDGFLFIPNESSLYDLAYEKIITARKGGLDFGLVDYLIVLQALKYNLILYTRDKTMLQVARNLRVQTV